MKQHPQTARVVVPVAGPTFVQWVSGRPQGTGRRAAVVV